MHLSWHSEMLYDHVSREVILLLQRLQLLFFQLHQLCYFIITNCSSWLFSMHLYDKKNVLKINDEAGGH